VIIGAGIIHWLLPDLLLVVRLFKDYVCCLQEECSCSQFREEESFRGISCRMGKDNMGRHASSLRQLLMGLASSLSSSMDGTDD
jgi:hypothetical protein